MGNIIPNSLKLFWLFFLVLSFLPLIAAIVPDKTDKDNKK